MIDNEYLKDGIWYKHFAIYGVDEIVECEMVHLMRLGLWAKEHAIPMLKNIVDEYGAEVWAAKVASKALSALPKEEE